MHLSSRADGEKHLGLVRGLRPGKEEALAEAASEGPHPCALRFGFDALGDDAGAEHVREHADHVRDLGRGRIPIDAADEAAVDLDAVERKGAEIAQRGIAGTEIVERERRTERLDLMQEPGGAFGVGFYLGEQRKIVI